VAAGLGAIAIFSPASASAFPAADAEVGELALMWLGLIVVRWLLLLGD